MLGMRIIARSFLPQTRSPPHMKLLFDLFPVILFFVTFKFAEGSPESAASVLEQISIGVNTTSQAPILLATLVVILATLFQIGWTWWRHRHVDKMLWISLILVVVLGGLTVALRDDNFIKWKPTGLYWAMGLGLLLATFVFRKNPLHAMLGEKLTLPLPVWNRLNLIWGAFFIVLGFVNLYVAYNFSTDTWVNFKLFGLTGLTLLFVLAQGFIISPHLQDNADNQGTP